MRDITSVLGLLDIMCPRQSSAAMSVSLDAVLASGLFHVIAMSFPLTFSQRSHRQAHLSA